MWNVAEKVYMVGLNGKFINFEIPLFADFANKPLDVAPYAIELHWVFGIFRLPHKVEAVLTN